jgi:hypothetical protein
LLAQVKGGDVQAVMSDELVGELSFLHEVLEYAISYEQIQIQNLACGEMFLRRVQHIRQAFRHSRTKPRLEFESLFMGTSHSQSASVAPELFAYIAEKLKDEQKLKERRLLAEEEEGKGKQ